MCCTQAAHLNAAPRRQQRLQRVSQRRVAQLPPVRQPRLLTLRLTARLHPARLHKTRQALLPARQHAHGCGRGCGADSGDVGREEEGSVEELPLQHRLHARTRLQLMWQRSAQGNLLSAALKRTPGKAR